MSFDITGTIIGNGITTPTLPVAVVEGGTQVVTFTPDAGWSVGNITIDGFDLGVIASHTFDGVYSDYNIVITFIEDAETVHTIDVQDNIAGIISPAGLVQVVDGADQVFGITPSAGYTQTYWVIDDVNVAASPTYTFSNVLTDHTIGAILTKDISYQPQVKLLCSEEFTVKRRNFDRGSYNSAGYREQGPLYQTFIVIGNRQPGQTQSGILQAVGSQVIQDKDYDYLNESWKIFTEDRVFPKDIFVFDSKEYEVLDVDDWTRYTLLNSINFRSMVRQIKPRG